MPFSVQGTDHDHADDEGGFIDVHSVVKKELPQD
jgi:hypothetical protein